MKTLCLSNECARHLRVKTCRISKGKTISASCERKGCKIEGNSKLNHRMVNGYRFESMGYVCSLQISPFLCVF